VAKMDYAPQPLCAISVQGGSVRSHWLCTRLKRFYSTDICHSYLVERVGIKRKHPFRDGALTCTHAHARNQNEAGYHRLEHRRHFIHWDVLLQ